MGCDTTLKTDALCIGYHGPQDKTVPPLLLSAIVIEDPGTLFRTLALSQVEDEFGAVAVVVEQATYQRLIEITQSMASDVTAEVAILSVTMIDTRTPSASTLTLSKPAASGYMGQVLTTVQESTGFDVINAWIARTNLVRR